MPLTAHEFLGVLDDAIAVAERQGKRKNDHILELTGSPSLPSLGQTGTPDTDDPGVYWYTLKQCREMRETILAAARSDAGMRG